jgi:arginyl-tRNA synthetase
MFFPVSDKAQEIHQSYKICKIFLDKNGFRKAKFALCQPNTVIAEQILEI